MSMKENPISRKWNLLMFISVTELFLLTILPLNCLCWEGIVHLSNNTSKLDLEAIKEDRLNQKEIENR